MIKEIIAIIDSLQVNKSNGEKAVYKPLLLLIIFHSILRGEKNLFKYNDLEIQLSQLMNQYGWKRKSKKRTAYPFSFLASSILWELDLNNQSFKHKSAPTKIELANSRGKLNSKVYDYLLNNSNQNKKIIKYIEEKFFNSRKISM